MKKKLKKAVLFGMGVASLTKERIEKFVEELVEEGDISVEEGRKMVKEFAKNAEKQQKKISKNFKKRVDKALEKMPLATKKDLKKLERKMTKGKKKKE